MKVNSNLDVKTLQKATALAEKIQNMQSELNALLNGQTFKACKNGKTSKRTPAQRAAISAGLKAKWAARKAQTETAPATATA